MQTPENTGFCVVIDASNISAGDLENIIETETPPQSPPATESEPLVNEFSSNNLLGLSDRRRRGLISHDLNLLSASAAVESCGSPVSSLPSSPTVDFKVRSPPPFSPLPASLSAPLSAPLPAPLHAPLSAVAKTPSSEFGVRTDAGHSTSNMLEAIKQRQQDQVARIAEYNKRDSLVIGEQQVASSAFVVLVTRARACS